MLRRNKALLLIVLALVATLASTAVPGTAHLAYPGTMDCEQGCAFVAAGWPWAFLIDSHGISVRGSVSLFAVVTGEDILDARLLAATFSFWFAVSLLLAWFFATWRRRTASKSPSL
jgi:hypothetical protein